MILGGRSQYVRKTANYDTPLVINSNFAHHPFRQMPRGSLL
jgi:hypothetical protein